MLKEKSVVDIKKFYEKKYNRKVETYDFSDKEVLLKYIEKYPLDSSNAVALLKDKEVRKEERGDRRFLPKLKLWVSSPTFYE